jgi:hypothetical protein
VGVSCHGVVLSNVSRRGAILADVVGVDQEIDVGSADILRREKRMSLYKNSMFRWVFVFGEEHEIRGSCMSHVLAKLV